MFDYRGCTFKGVSRTWHEQRCKYASMIECPACRKAFKYMTTHNPNKCYINITRRKMRQSEQYPEFGLTDYITDQEMLAVIGYFIDRPLRDLYKNDVKKIRHNAKQKR